MAKTFISTQKYVLTTPRKLRLVADAIRKMSPSEALATLPYVGRRAAEPLSKVLSSAIANAGVQGVAADNLKFSEIQISQGPALKRGIAVSRGQWHPIKKRMSHIRVVLQEKEIKKAVVKDAKVSKKLDAQKDEKEALEPAKKKVLKSANK